MTKLEQILKEKLDQAEVPFNSDHWDEMNDMLDAQSSGVSNKTKRFIGAAAIIAGVALGGMLLNSETTSDIKTTAQNTVVETPKNVLTESVVVTETATTSSTDVEAIKSVDNNMQQAAPTALKLTSNKVSTPAESTINEQNNSTNNRKSGSAASGWGKFSVSATEVCLGQKIVFSIEGLTDPVSYLWTFGNGKTSNLPSPSHTYAEAGTYDVSLTLTDITTGIDSVQTKEGLITILAAPQFELDWELSEVLDIDAQVNYEALGLNPNETISWNLGDGNVSNEIAFTHKYAEVAIYNVTATATNHTTSCQTTVAEDVKVVNRYNLLAPNSFTPNGDGINDGFIPKGLISLNLPFTFEIYNPRDGGQLVYQTSQLIEWNGKVNNSGEKMKVGIYSWISYVTKPDGSKKKFAGSINLLQ